MLSLTPPRTPIVRCKFMKHAGLLPLGFSAAIIPKPLQGLACLHILYPLSGMKLWLLETMQQPHPDELDLGKRARRSPQF